MLKRQIFLGTSAPYAIVFPGGTVVHRAMGARDATLGRLVLVAFYVHNKASCDPSLLDCGGAYNAPLSKAFRSQLATAVAAARTDGAENKTQAKVQKQSAHHNIFNTQTLLAQNSQKRTSTRPRKKPTRLAEDSKVQFLGIKHTHTHTKDKKENKKQKQTQTQQPPTPRKNHLLRRRRAEVRQMVKKEKEKQKQNKKKERKKKIKRKTKGKKKQKTKNTQSHVEKT
jgi:hypothetical protein